MRLDHRREYTYEQSVRDGVLAVIVDIDSLRPDHLGAYGYDRLTSPNLDAFADDAVRFTRSYAANSPCMPRGRR